MLSLPKERRFIDVLDHIVDATDEISDLGVAGFLHPPPEVPLMMLKLLGRKKVGDEVLYHYLIV